MAITEYQLSDRFLKDDGRAFLTGVQALRDCRSSRCASTSATDSRPQRSSPATPAHPRRLRHGARKGAAAGDRCRRRAPTCRQRRTRRNRRDGEPAPTEQPDATYEGVLGIWYGKARVSTERATLSATRTSPAPPRRAGRSPSSATTRGEVIDDSVVVRRNDLRPPHAALLSGRRAGGRRPRPSRWRSAA